MRFVIGPDGPSLRNRSAQLNRPIEETDGSGKVMAFECVHCLNGLPLSACGN